MLDWFLDWLVVVLGVDCWGIGWEDRNEFYDPNGN
jgi:hypothetical protein